MFDLILFFAAFVLSFFLVPIAIRTATYYNLISPKDYRRSNQIPLLGGIAIFMSCLLVVTPFYYSELFPLFVCALPLVFVSLLDDLIEMNSKLRITVQIGCVLAYFLLKGDANFVLTSMGMPVWMAVPCMVFWSVGIINAINMIDGQDLEASSFSLVACVVLAIIFWGQAEGAFLLALGGSVLGFMFYNKPPAKIYMGDCGSMFLGFALSVLSLEVTSSSSFSLGALFVPLVIFAFPEIDAILAIARRFRRSGSIMAADKDHLHHKLQKIGFSVKQSALIIFSIIVYTGVAGFANYRVDSLEQFVILNSLVVSAMLMVLASVFIMENKLGHQVSNLSQTLLHKALIKRPNFKSEMEQPSTDVVVYDLLPYYKEMQFRGVVKVGEFIESFSSFLDEFHQDWNIFIYGSYTVIVVSKEEFLSQEDRNLIISKYYQFIKGHDVMKSESPIPWGMSFYGQKSKDQKILEKFGIMTKDQDTIEKIKSA